MKPHIGSHTFQASSFQLLKLEIHCEDHISPSYISAVIYESFHILHVISLLSRENKNSQLTSLPMCGFIAQLVEHRTGIAEVTGSNPVEALIFFRLLHSNLKLEIHCEDHISPSYISAVIYESFHILHVISLLSRENKNSQLTSLPMCGFIAQLVEHRTGIAEVTGSNPVEPLIFFFFRLLHSNCLNWKFTAKITYHRHLLCWKCYLTILSHALLKQANNLKTLKVV